MNKYIFLLLAFPLLFPIASALDENQVPLITQQNYPYDIKIPCSLNGWYCPSTTLCNITLVYPNSTTAINNQRMSYAQQYFNFTITSARTEITGRHSFDVKCSDTSSGLNDSTTGILYVTPSGKLLTDGENWLMLSAVLVLIILGIIFMLMSLFVPPGPVKMFVAVLGMIIVLGSVMLTTNVLQNYVVSNNTFTKALEYIFIALAYLGGAAFVLLLVFVLIQTLKFMKDKARFTDEN